MLIKLFTIYVYLQSALCGCGADKRNGGFEKLPFKYKLERISRLDSQIVESSGLARASDSTFWTHSDGNNPALLFEVDNKGKLLKTNALEVPNIDWEDLAEDKSYLYVGDFGNNMNNRQDLTVYKFLKTDNSLKGSINFKLQDQVSFPPTKNNLHFDIESFFWYQDSLYLFTKSRGKHKKVKLYSMPAEPGNYVAKLLEELPLNAMTTASDISPVGDQFAVLGYGKLYFFDMSEGKVSLAGKRYCLPLSRTGQAEALLYTTPDQLLITNESGKIFRLTLKNN
jgi:hypothetical protein